MIRQAGQVCRAAAAFTRRVPWPLGARVGAQVALPPRHSRALHSPPDAAAPAEPIQSGHASSSAQEPHPSPGPGSETAQPPSHPGPSQQTEDAHEGREGLGDETEPGSSRIGAPAKTPRFPRDRFPLHMPALVHRHRATGKSFGLLAAQYREWDATMRVLVDRLGGHTSDGPPTTENLSRGLEALEKLLAFETIQEMRASWLATHWDEREVRWMHMMRAAMAFRPESAAMVLEATVEPPDTPVWAVADLFAFAVKWASKPPDGRRASQRAHLPKLLLHLLRISGPQHYQFRQWALGKTISICDPDTAAEIYKALRKYNHPLHFNTQLKIAWRLTKGSKYKLAALEIFEGALKDPEVDNNDRRFAALATELFTLPPGWKKGGGSPVDVQLLAEAFERVVGLGFSLNVVTYTAMIRSLCLTNQLDTAWKIYDSLRSQEATPDPHVFSILLNGAKRAVSLDSTIRVFEEATPDALRVPYLWNDLMHIILLAATEEARVVASDSQVAVPAFSSMLQVYAKFFKLKPLQELIPVDLQRRLDQPPDDASENLDWKATLALLLDELPVSPPDKLVEPGIDTLGIMLLGYVRGFSTAAPVLSFYSHFRGLLKNRNPVAISLLSYSTLPYDAILKSLTGNTGMLRTATDIVNTMLKDATDSAAALKRSSAEPDPDPIFSPTTATQATTTTTTTPTQKFTRPAFHHPPPSVYTWSILIRAFSRERSPSAAARILAVMRRHGVEPNSVTWHTLLGGFARRQDAPRVMAVLNQLDEARVPPNRHTIRGVSKLRNPDAVLERLEARAAAREDERWRMVEDAAVLPPPDGPAAWNRRLPKLREASSETATSPRMGLSALARLRALHPSVGFRVAEKLGADAEAEPASPAERQQRQEVFRSERWRALAALQANRERRHPRPPGPGQSSSSSNRTLVAPASFRVEELGFPSDPEERQKQVELWKAECGRATAASWAAKKAEGSAGARQAALERRAAKEKRPAKERKRPLTRRMALTRPGWEPRRAYSALEPHTRSGLWRRRDGEEEKKKSSSAAAVPEQALTRRDKQQARSERRLAQKKRAKMEQGAIERAKKERAKKERAENESAEKRVSDEELESYLRMYDELVFNKPT